MLSATVRLAAGILMTSMASMASAAPADDDAKSPKMGLDEATLKIQEAVRQRCGGAGGLDPACTYRLVVAFQKQSASLK